MEVWLDGAFLVDYECDDLPRGEGYAGIGASGADLHGMAAFAMPTPASAKVAAARQGGTRSTRIVHARLDSKLATAVIID